MVLCPCRASGIDITGQWGSEEIYPLTLSLTHTGEGHGQADIDRDGNKDRHNSGIKWAGLSNGEATASWELRGYIRYSLTGRQSYFLQLNKEAGLSLKGKQRGRKMIYSWTKRLVCITLLLEVSTGEESSGYKHPEHKALRDTFCTHCQHIHREQRKLCHPHGAELLVLDMLVPMATAHIQ